MANGNQEQNLLDLAPSAKPQGPVECLGMTFENDEKRREYFLEKLREKLKDPEFRKIEGFPIGEDDDILALSDPPYYTACPNPFIEDLIKHYGKPYDPKTDSYSREPFAIDVSEGKNNPFYRAHSYHTKVPHRAILQYILHYTDPGDTIFDGFSGSGMTGLAAYFCGHSSIKEKMYIVDLIKRFELKNPVFGNRLSIIGDLGPAATSIGNSYNRKINALEYSTQAQSLISELENEWGWAYETMHTDGKTKGTINYTVISDYFLCPSCGAELCYWDIAVDKSSNEHKEKFECISCKTELQRKDLIRAFTNEYDDLAEKIIKKGKRKPIIINYYIGKKSYQKAPDDFDLNILKAIEEKKEYLAIPIQELPHMHMTHERNNLPAQGVSYVHHFYTKRNLLVAGSLWQKIRDKYPLMINVFTAINPRLITMMSAYRVGKGKSNLRTGTLYIPSLTSDYNVIDAFKSKYKVLKKIRLDNKAESLPHCISTTQSHTSLPNIPSNSIDYIFTDPPFGENIYYSDLNFIWETWLRVRTNAGVEAIVDKAKEKNHEDYKDLMSKCFVEAYRILKPGRWITVEFHNSQNSIWNAIQTALAEQGFVVADVRTLDKKQGSIKQIIESSAVKQDLIISAYKPNIALQDRFRITGGTEDAVWDFVRTHLKQLPVFVSKDGKAEVIAERQHFLLFDRMVAFHVQRGITVPLSASEFYAGLEHRFPPRDGMYFLPDQAPEYDKKRMTVKEILQLQLFVSDEASAIQWLKQLITKKSQTFQDIHPQFLREIGGWQKHEKALELLELLEQNFLRYDGKSKIPNQIHSYLSSNFKELRNLDKDEPALKAKAKDRWYVPDPNKAGDLEKLREKALLKEFEEYKQRTRKFSTREKFRFEAVRAGFKKAWQERDYATIIAVAGKIPEGVLQEDPKLLMWYDQALTRTKI